MGYHIEKRRMIGNRIMWGGVWTHHVKRGDYIVFRGTEEQCRNFMEAATEFDRKQNKEKA